MDQIRNSRELASHFIDFSKGREDSLFGKRDE